MRINHKLLRHPGIKLAIPLRCLVEADYLHPHHFGDIDAIPHDRLHQLAVVFHGRGLASMFGKNRTRLMRLAGIT